MSTYVVWIELGQVVWARDRKREPQEWMLMATEDLSGGHPRYTVQPHQRAANMLQVGGTTRYGDDLQDALTQSRNDIIGSTGATWCEVARWPCTVCLSKK